MSSASSRSAPRVLVVEGRERFREALRDALSATFSVLTSRSSEGALGGFSTYQPRAVLICESQSGDMGGLELVAALRAGDLGENCLLIVYGGTRLDEAAVKREFGVDEYLSNKATLGEIDELLCKHLRVGWSPMDVAGEDEEDSGRFRHPMAGQEMISARVHPEEASKKTKKKGFLSRLFGS